MNLDEAKNVAKVVELAEGGCSGCIESATESLNKLFPDFHWSLVEIPDFSPGINVKRTSESEHDMSEPSKYGSCGYIKDEWIEWNNKG